MRHLFYQRNINHYYLFAFPEYTNKDNKTITRIKILVVEPIQVSNEFISYISNWFSIDPILDVLRVNAFDFGKFNSFFDVVLAWRYLTDNNTCSWFPFRLNESQLSINLVFLQLHMIKCFICLFRLTKFLHHYVYSI